MVSEDSVSTEASTVKSGLTPQQIQQFKDDGFLIIRDLLPHEAIQPLIDELSQGVDKATDEAVKQGVLDPAHTFDNAPFETRLAQVCKACTEPDWVWHNYFSSQKPRTAGMFILRTAPALLDVVESLMGPEILAHPQFNYRAKLPDQDLTVIPWHQDLAYLRPEEAGDTLVVNFWIPLVDATVTNGCMEVMRGSHRLGLLPHSHLISTPGHKGGKGIPDPDLPSCEVVAGEVAVGDVLMTTERLVHRSIPNRSDTVRWSVDTRYNQIGLPTGRESVPGFIARSHKQPERVAQSHHDWNRLFEN